MVDFSEKLRDDQIEQFKEQSITGVLVSAFGRQLNEVAAFFEDLILKRTIETAVGMQLDGIGDIVCLSRDEAAKYAGMFPSGSIGDEEYRTLLKAKIIINTNDATYHGIVRSIRSLYGVYPVYYSENLAYPATIILELDAAGVGNIAPFGFLPPVKAAGVAILWQYTIRAIINIGCNLQAWTYSVPLCGTIRCGTWWMHHTLGWSGRHRLTVEVQTEPFSVSPELSGTLPVIKTPGYSLRADLRINGQADAYPAQPQEAGVILSGTEWMRHTLGWSGRVDTLVTGQADAYGISPEFTGTLPGASKLGYTFVCGAVRSGGVATAFTGSPKEAGEPEVAGTWPETATLGHSMTAGAVRAGGGAEAFMAVPELAGTLPDTAATGYTIAGELSTVGSVDGFKTEPEMTGTLPESVYSGQ